jgi:hypothetical protein
MAKPEWMAQRLYQWTKPRSLGLHVLFVVIAGGCAIAMWWQVHRAMQGNVLSYLYSVEWPAIAVVVGIGWWQMVHDTPDDIARRSEYHRRMRAASAEVVARTLPRSARALTVDSEEMDGRAIGPASARALTSGAPGADLQGVGRGLVPTAGADGLATRLLDPDGGDDGAPADEMTEYNRYLAALAVKGRPKTWRNPLGL